MERPRGPRGRAPLEARRQGRRQGRRGRFGEGLGLQTEHLLAVALPVRPIDGTDLPFVNQNDEPTNLMNLHEFVIHSTSKHEKRCQLDHGSERVFYMK